MIDENYISDRIGKLRTERNISARDMSLSLGQSQSYINNIENKKALPSMQMFLYICEYLKIAPKDFFDEGISCPPALSETVQAISPLKQEQLKLIIELAKQMK